MAYTNILSRRINLAFINLGFSGNGKGEPELARLIAGITNPACLVLDYEANVQSMQLQQTLLPFIDLYREVHPHVPILVVSRITHAKEAFDPVMSKERAERKRIQRQAVETCRKRGDKQIYFADGSLLLGETAQAQECTVDGSHPTDLGFLLMADGLTPVLRQILQLDSETLNKDNRP